MTREDYKYRIGLFMDFIKTQGFALNSFLDFKRMLAERTDLSVATKNKYLATAKVFLKELNKQGILPMDVTQNIKTFSQDKKHKRDGLSDDEIRVLSQKIKGNAQNAKNTRLKAILTFLTLQGLRQIEIVKLDVKDVDLFNKYYSLRFLATMPNVF